MPLKVYTPDWDAIRAFYSKIRTMLPPDYTGWVGVRLHRTGNPLALEILGPEIPEKDLPPMAAFEVVKGEPKLPWEKLATEFEVPWVRPSDFHRYRGDVMTFYHAEDLLEARAEEILKSEAPDRELLRKATFDHAGVLAAT
jgi:hypothetical protein